MVQIVYHGCLVFWEHPGHHPSSQDAKVSRDNTIRHTAPRVTASTGPGDLSRFARRCQVWRLANATLDAASDRHVRKTTCTCRFMAKRHYLSNKTSHQSLVTGRLPAPESTAGCPSLAVLSRSGEKKRISFFPCNLYQTRCIREQYRPPFGNWRLYRSPFERCGLQCSNRREYRPPESDCPLASSTSASISPNHPSRLSRLW